MSGSAFAMRARQCSIASCALSFRREIASTKSMAEEMPPSLTVTAVLFKQHTLALEVVGLGKLFVELVVN
jgi:hypothetical protein